MSTAISSVANIIDSFKFIAGTDGAFTGYIAGAYGTALTSTGLNLARFLSTNPGVEGTITRINARTGILNFSYQHSLIAQTFIPPQGTTGIFYSTPTHSFNYLVVKNSLGVEIAEYEMLQAIENNSAVLEGTVRNYFFFNTIFYGGQNQDIDFYAVSITVVDSDTFTFPLTVTKRGKAVPKE